jgi:hypothetical protein
VTIRRKVDSEEIRAFLRSLGAQPWLGQAQRWWPELLFRFDNIEAVARILGSNKLLSRKAAIDTGVMLADCASPEVISGTSERWKQYARLHFRPRTPTQHSNEGFRPIGQWTLHAHCPAPVVMLFDAAEVMTREETLFSNGNLATNADTGHDAVFLKSIPFDKVYHDSWFDRSDKAAIIFHRHAEVIIPNELDLTPLRFIGCRTQAEYETLLHLLDPRARKQWSPKIGLGMKANLHFRRWTFVEQVQLTTKEIVFSFNPSSVTPSAFHCQVTIREDEGGQEYQWEAQTYQANSSLKLDLSRLKHPESYAVSLRLDGQLAYGNQYVEENLPF